MGVRGSTPWPERRERGPLQAEAGGEAVEGRGLLCREGLECGEGATPVSKLAQRFGQDSAGTVALDARRSGRPDARERFPPTGPTKGRRREAGGRNHTPCKMRGHGAVTVQSTAAFREAKVEPCQESGWDYQSGLHQWKPGLQDGNREDKRGKRNKDKPELRPGEREHAEAEIRKRGSSGAASRGQHSPGGRARPEVPSPPPGRLPQ